MKMGKTGDNNLLSWII